MPCAPEAGFRSQCQFEKLTMQEVREEGAEGASLRQVVKTTTPTAGASDTQPHGNHWTGYRILQGRASSLEPLLGILWFMRFLKNLTVELDYAKSMGSRRDGQDGTE